MLAQVLDIQDNCKGIYYNGTFSLEPEKNLLNQITKTWKHSSLLDDDAKLTFLYILAKGEDLSNFSVDKEQFLKAQKIIESQQRACNTAKINIKESCFFDVLPQHHLSQWFHVRHEALKNLTNQKDKPEDYEILHKIHVLTSQISSQKINFESQNRAVKYEMFGSATGRLTTRKGSVPVLTLKKEQRKLLKPQNDAFVELDLNAAEIRMLIALSGQRQPEKDIHEWVSENVFANKLTREEVKVKIFSWLYNFSAPKSQLDKIFSRQIFRDFYLPEKQLLSTPFGRKLSVDERKAQNYLLQSSTSDQVLENAYKIQKMLKATKSKIAFTLHDSIILDMDKKDAIMLKEIKDKFESTRWGNFMSTCKIGKTFGSLKEFKI